MSTVTVSPILSEYIIELNTVPMSDMNIFPEEPDMHFGVLTLKTVKTKISKNPVLFKFDIDISSSMSEISGRSNNSKMDYVKNTFTNMILFLAEEPDAQIYLQVGTFNSKYANLIDTIRITQENHQDLIEKVQKIQPSTATNIEQTFTESAKIISDYSAEFPKHQIAYILLTDGNATEGNQNNEYLASIVPKGCDVFCIGYGRDHCARLLNTCGEYYFINDFEITGKVYGEIVFAMLYLAVSNVEIRMENDAKIYDAVKNEWVSSLMIPKIYGDKEVTYSLKCPKEGNNSAIITGTVIGEPIESDDSEQINTTGPVQLCLADQLPNLLNEDGTIEPIDLRKYMYKQATQQFLYECIELSTNNRDLFESNEKIKKYSEEVQAFYRKIKKFILENNLEDDVFMKVLCDDIYTSYKTVGRESSATFTVMRQRAHARDMVYRVATDELNEFTDMNYFNRLNNYLNNTVNSRLTRSTTINRDYNSQDYEYADDQENTEHYNDGTQVLDFMQNNNHTDSLQRYVSSTHRDEEIYLSPTLTQTIRRVSGR